MNAMNFEGIVFKKAFHPMNVLHLKIHQIWKKLLGEFFGMVDERRKAMFPGLQAIVVEYFRINLKICWD
jgi:hypothetical protein